MMNVDAILYPRWVIPIEPHNVVYDNYAVIIHQERIVDLLPQTEVSKKYQSATIINLDHHAIMPGFVNAHTHSPMIFFRGLADDLPLMEWLNDCIWPAERKWVSESLMRDGTRLAIAEMIKNGTTCFNEHYFYPDITVEVVKETGMRATVGLLVIDVPTGWSQNEEDSFHKGVEIFERLTPHLPALIRFSMAPHSVYTTSDKMLQKIRIFTDKHQLPIHMHVHETAFEIKESLTKYDKRPLQRLHELGLLSSRFQCVHMTQTTDEDIDLLVTTKANVTHCPESNLKLASGYCPVQKLLDHHINVALGTDSAVSNNNLDMLSEMRVAALIGKTVANSPIAVHAADALRMATLGGAIAMGLEKEIGSIEIGKSADLIAIDLNRLATQPIYQPISQIVYAASNDQITDVWVAGKMLLKNRQLTTLDEKTILQNAKEWQQRIGYE